MSRRGRLLRCCDRTAAWSLLPFRPSAQFGQIQDVILCIVVRQQFFRSQCGKPVVEDKKQSKQSYFMTDDRIQQSPRGKIAELERAESRDSPAFGERDGIDRSEKRLSDFGTRRVMQLLAQLFDSWGERLRDRRRLLCRNRFNGRRTCRCCGWPAIALNSRAVAFYIFHSERSRGIFLWAAFNVSSSLAVSVRIIPVDTRAFRVLRRK